MALKRVFRAPFLVTGMYQPGWLAVRFHRLLRRLYVSRLYSLRVAGRVINMTVGPFVEAWTGVTLPPEVRVGRNLQLHHRGKIVINSSAVIGDDCVLVHGVTIGNRAPGGGAPRLGDRVEVGAYAQILGPISIGDDVRIGALSVVVRDVPSGSSVRGQAATIHPLTGDEGA